MAASPEPDQQRLLLGLGVKLTSQELGDYQIQRQLSSGAAVMCSDIVTDQHISTWWWR